VRWLTVITDSISADNQYTWLGIQRIWTDADQELHDSLSISSSFQVGLAQRQLSAYGGSPELNY
jgi:hypothetical protein